MLILNINLYFDPAAVGETLVKAINKDGRHEARHLMTSRVDHMTPWRDVFYDILPEDELADLFDRADILHFNQYDWTHYFDIGIGRNLCDVVTKHIKPRHKLIFHGHGGGWLLNPDPQRQRCKDKNAKMVVCSPLDLQLVPEATWMQNIMILDEHHAPNWNRDFYGNLLVGNASNHGGGLYKGVGLIKYMVDYLYDWHQFPVFYEQITDMKLDEALNARKYHHFTVDNWVQGFHGMAGLEGLALGHAVFSRYDPCVWDAWKEFAPEMIPIIDVKGFDTCAREIRRFCNDREALIEQCHKGHEWIHKYYTEEILLNKWIDFYEDVLKGE